jgi:hypothetical protein
VRNFFVSLLHVSSRLEKTRIATLSTTSAHTRNFFFLHFPCKIIKKENRAKEMKFTILALLRNLFYYSLTNTFPGAGTEREGLGD